MQGASWSDCLADPLAALNPAASTETPGSSPLRHLQARCPQGRIRNHVEARAAGNGGPLRHNDGFPAPRPSPQPRALGRVFAERWRLRRRRRQRRIDLGMLCSRGRRASARPFGCCSSVGLVRRVPARRADGAAEQCGFRAVPLQVHHQVTKALTGLGIGYGKQSSPPGRFLRISRGPCRQWGRRLGRQPEARVRLAGPATHVTGLAPPDLAASTRSGGISTESLHLGRCCDHRANPRLPIERWCASVQPGSWSVQAY
jgi:hypothetical protein